MIEPSDLMALIQPEGTPVGDVSPGRLSELVASTVADQAATMEALIGAMLNPSAVARPQTIWHAHRNAELRHRFMNEFAVCTSAEVARLAGSRASNPHALASRWRSEGRIFSVTWGGAEVFPAFQLDQSGRPLPPVARVIEAFPRGAGGWEIAIWWITANAWLGGRRPVDVLGGEGQAVAEAARLHFQSAQAF